jgi:hypothetical protein
VNDALVVDAIITLEPEKVGQTARFPSGTRSLLIRFRPASKNDQVDLGAIITAQDGSDISSNDTDKPVTLTFWADEAELFVVPGEGFTIWYGREIGRGSIVSPHS